ncbi:tetratricopeptide repeat protein [Actinomyces slackii]|uniref:Predicted O-linked N-acetylglucosamine transferase, SPINDLY family n=1 Tax=Actinomyces slackii TaxID=52774 RepID=A0A3S5EM14_9ACTO|nr:tetratricopeptide repeat protein [Actinomyces slackii]VEG73561.1 Predicted O-linked N-acetylglucosamine transferase, SPINDLY family [Actinomyces slackii]
MGGREGRSDGEVDREELRAFLAGAPESLRGWAEEQLAGLEAPQGGQDGEPADPATTDEAAAARGGSPEDAADIEDILDEDEAPVPQSAAASAPVESSLQQRTGVSRINLLLVVLLTAAVVIIIQQRGQGSEPASPMMPSDHPSISSTADPAAMAEMDAAQPVDRERETELKAAAEADPNDTESRQELGVMYINAALYEDAIPYFQQILDVDPDNVQALLAIGVAEYQSSDYDSAETHWRRTAELDPTAAEPWYNLGFLYMAQDPPKPDQARECWSKVIEVAPDSTMAASVRTHLEQIGTAAPSAGPTVAPSGGATAAPSAGPTN